MSKLFKEFWNYKRTLTEELKEFHLFTTFRGEQIPRQDCVCGEIYRFKECLYLIQSLYTPGWNPDLKI